MKIGQGDLALCTGSTERHLFRSKPVSNATCLERVAKVRLLILEPGPQELAEEMRGPNFGEWADTKASLMNRTEVWFHHTELGARRRHLMARAA